VDSVSFSPSPLLTTLLTRHSRSYWRIPRWPRRLPYVPPLSLSLCDKLTNTKQLPPLAVSPADSQAAPAAPVASVSPSIPAHVLESH
jgi:hypothetical protein